MPINKMNASAIKTAICGDSGVGKTSLCLRLVGKEPPLTYISTIGLDLECKILPERRIMIHYWDLAGNRKYEPLTVLYMKNISFIILVYSVENLESVDRIVEIYNDYKNINPPKKFIIVGTHCNSQSEHHKCGIEFAQKQNLPHFLVDNKNNKGFNVIQEYILNNHFPLQSPKKRLSCMENPCMDGKRDNCIIS
jgi:small GTP-binding protein